MIFLAVFCYGFNLGAKPARLANHPLACETAKLLQPRIFLCGKSLKDPCLEIFELQIVPKDIYIAIEGNWQRMTININDYSKHFQKWLSPVQDWSGLSRVYRMQETFTGVRATVFRLNLWEERSFDRESTIASIIVSRDFYNFEAPITPTFVGCLPIKIIPPPPPIYIPLSLLGQTG